MNLIYNSEENRFRAGIRLLSYLFLTIVAAIISGLIPNTVLSYIALSVTFFGVAWLIAKGMDKRSLSGYGLESTKRWWLELLIGIGMAIAAQTVIFVAQWQMGWIEITGFGWNRPGTEFWLISVSIAFVQMASVGFYEELVFRGYALRNLAEGFTTKAGGARKGAIWATAFTSVFFGVAHIANPNADFISTFNIVLAGFMLAIPFLLTGRLAISIGIHFAWNFVMGSVYGFPVSGIEFRRSVINIRETGPDLITGGNFGPEAGVMGILAMLLILGLIFLYHKRTAGNFEMHPSFKEPYQKPEELG